jgi:hypothetical protein
MFSILECVAFDTGYAGSNGLEPQSWVNGNGTSYIYFGSGEFDGQGSGHDYLGTLYMPSTGSINNCDGGRTHTYCDYLSTDCCLRTPFGSPLVRLCLVQSQGTSILHSFVTFGEIVRWSCSSFLLCSDSKLERFCGWEGARVGAGVQRHKEVFQLFGVDKEAH